MKCREGERKELDSPMTMKTDVSSSCDEQSLMTPPPMTSRLGRVISMNGDGDGDGDGDDENRTSSHRRRNMWRSINRSKQDEETDDQSEVLISALHQLHRLATLDSTEYQQRLLENSLPGLQTEQPKSLYCPSLAESSASTKISQLSQPIQTPLVQLSMSIHRLHAAVANITQEVDGHTDEVHELQSQLAVLRRRNQQVESAAKKVHKKNIKLKQQAQHDRKMAHGLQHKVQQYEAQLESQGFQLLASQVHQHEIQLQLSKSQHSNNGSEDDRGQFRERIDSNISDFLDLELESQDDNSSKSVQTNETDSQETLPVLRFSAEGSITPDRKIASSCEQGSSSGSIATNPIVDEVNHRESDSSEERSQVSHKQQPTGDADAMETTTNLTSFSNRFAKFLGTRSISNYNLKIVPPCNIQFVGLPLNTSASKYKTEKMSPANTEVVEDHGIVQTNDTSTRSLDDGLSPDSQKLPSAFAVCGLDGFNTEINMKPTVGAQLVKINGKTIDDECTLETLYNKLDKKSGTKNRAKPIVLTFRNELWDTAQTKVLNAAILRVECKNSSTSVNSSNDGRKENKNDGLSLFESHQTRTNSFEGGGPQSDGGLTNSPLQRVRTASNDSVGKAIHGIGNFLQNLNHSEDGI
jgi:hypothetical protein